MTIFVHTLKRIFRNKIQFFFILLFPLAFMSLGFIGDEHNVKAAIIDKDHTEFTAALQRNLQSKAAIRSIAEEEIEKRLMSLKVDYVLVIDQGFTNRLIRGEEGGITAYSIQESNVAAPVSASLELWLSHAKTIALAVNHDPDAFYAAFAQYDEQSLLQADHRLVIDPGAERTRWVLGYFVISMLYSSLIAALYIILNKNNRTLYRTLAAPVTIRSYMLQTIGSFLVVCLVQITFALVVIRSVYNMYMGDSVVDMYLFLAAFSLVSVSLGVAISSISKSVVQACLIGISLFPPITMLGGAYFPLDFAPEIIQTLSKLSPVSWVIGGIQKLLLGQTIMELGKEISIMLLFSLIFFLFGTMRKADIVK
ncbi:ABC transporter permease [Paenibacillus thermotolerans]|uniref:ABC transporter permease n=1 Tax=Paenibacillus thermotolerans TaxID=3027807 RepID=UPI002368E269|nr:MULTISPECIES: ABC transporter permease [unclassified Paenibacillus]